MDKFEAKTTPKKSLKILPYCRTQLKIQVNILVQKYEDDNKNITDIRLLLYPT